MPPPPPQTFRPQTARRHLTHQCPADTMPTLTPQLKPEPPPEPSTIAGIFRAPEYHARYSAPINKKAEAHCASAGISSLHPVKHIQSTLTPTFQTFILVSE